MAQQKVKTSSSQKAVKSAAKNSGKSGVKSTSKTGTKQSGKSTLPNQIKIHVLLLKLSRKKIHLNKK